MERRHIRVLPLGLLALGLVAGACRRPEGSATDSGRADTLLSADSVLAVPSAGDLTGDSAAAAPALPAGSVAAPARPGTARPATPASAAPGEPARGGSAPAAPERPAAQEDTVRGIVAEVGSVPVTSIVVKPAGGRSVTLLGSLAREIGQAAGAEVWVSGHRTAEGLHAMRYAVRSVDGQPAVDGTLAAEGDELFLVTASGRRRITRPPQALRGKIGARVWLVGSLDGGVTSYGVLRDAP